MININQLTTQLRMLPDQALQRVAMMYKQDPYILPLVVSEGMARKKMRAASQAQMAQPQPKVADQAVASLGYTPEEVGIAQLQAQNMQGLADGGIAGYADGGDMDFADHSEPVVRMADGGVARYQAGGQPTGISEKGRAVGVTPYGGVYGGERLLPTTTGYEGMSITEFLNAAYNDVSDAVKSLYDKIPKESLAQVVAEDLAKKKSQEAAERPAAGGARSAGVGGARAGEREAYEAQLAGAPASSAAPSGGTRSYATPGAGAATASSTGARSPAAGAPSDGGIYSLAGRLFDPLEAATQRRLDYARIAGRLRGEEERAEFEAGKPKEKAFAGLEGLLKREEEGAAAEKENAKALAIFNAGLAMMAGGSPRALENIAKGAMVGTGQYADAMKDFKKAARERMKMQADIEQARRAEARDDNKTALTLMQRANDREDRIENLTIEAGTKLGLDKASVIGRLYGTQMETESRERTARASDPLALFRALSVPGPIREGYEFAQRAKAEPVDERTYRKEWASSPVLQMNYPNVDDYVKMMMPRPQGGTPGAASQSADEALVRKYLNPPR